MLGIFEFGILKMSIVDFHSILINGFSSPQLENHRIALHGLSERFAGFDDEK
jgi:hypothetical protein